MGVVRDTLAASREAAVELARIDERGRLLRESIGVQGHTYETHPKTFIVDPMRRVVDLVTWEDEYDAGNALLEAVRDGDEIVRGASRVCDELGAEVLRRFYVEGEPMRSIAADVGERAEPLRGLTQSRRERAIREALGVIVGGLDRMGVARLRQLATEG